MADMNRTEKLGMAILCLMGAAFACFGLMALFAALRGMASPSGQSGLWFLLLFGAVFSVIGFGLIYLALTGSKRMARQKQVQSAHPGVPWMWRAELPGAVPTPPYAAAWPASGSRPFSGTFVSFLMSGSHFRQRGSATLRGHLSFFPSSPLVCSCCFGRPAPRWRSSNSGQRTSLWTACPA